MNTLLYKNIISHTLFLKEWCWLWVGDGDRLLYWPQVLLTIAALLPHLGWGCSTLGHWGSQALSLQADSHADILSPTDSNHHGQLIILLSHVHLLPLFFCLFTQVHLLIGGSVKSQSIKIVLQLVLLVLWDWKWLNSCCLIRYCNWSSICVFTIWLKNILIQAKLYKSLYLQFLSIFSFYFQQVILGFFFLMKSNISNFFK